jgi:hypothetical protein
MIHSMLRLRWFALIVVAGFLAGCSAPTPTPMPPPPPMQPNTPLPPPKLPETPIPPSAATISPLQSLQPDLLPDIFTLDKTIQITPDNYFNNGAVGYIHYIPSTGHFVVMVSVTLDQPVQLNSTHEVCPGKALAYEEYTAEMQPTGKHGYLACMAADGTTRMIGNDLYFVYMHANSQSGQVGWTLEKFDATTWQRKASVDIPLDFPTEQDGGPTISYVNGQVVVTGEYKTKEGPSGTHNHLFSTDLELQGKIILKPPEVPAHYCETSILQDPNGDILIFGSTDAMSSLLVLRFDKDWKFKEQKTLKQHAYFPTGSVMDNRHIYIAYTDVSNPDARLGNQDIRLAAYDFQWNLVQDVAVSHFSDGSNNGRYGESPWVELQGGRLYVSYLESRLDPSTKALIDSQAYVSIFTLTE